MRRSSNSTWAILLSSRAGAWSRLRLSRAGVSRPRLIARAGTEQAQRIWPVIARGCLSLGAQKEGAIHEVLAKYKVNGNINGQMGGCHETIDLFLMQLSVIHNKLAYQPQMEGLVMVAMVVATVGYPRWIALFFCSQMG